jgi:hypothetical protein
MPLPESPSLATRHDSEPARGSALSSTRINLDLAQESFLNDHRVHGTPLLPTVMAADALVWAVRGDVADPVELHDLVVGPPVLLDAGPRRSVEIRTGADSTGLDSVGAPGAGVRCALHGTARHYSASVSPGRHHYSWQAVPALRELPTPGELPISAAQIYPPYFHGPLLQVIASARVDAHGVTARLSTVPRLRWSTRPSVTAPTLLELCLQACGLWDLTRTGAMMIPDRLDRVVVAVPEALLGPVLPAARARVTPTVHADGRTSFDGVVVDDRGRLLLAVHGYHTANLPEAG